MTDADRYVTPEDLVAELETIETVARVTIECLQTAHAAPMLDGDGPFSAELRIDTSWTIELRYRANGSCVRYDQMLAHGPTIESVYGQIGLLLGLRQGIGPRALLAVLEGHGDT